MLNSYPKQKLLVYSCYLGNIIEYYDFALYGYFAPIIARTYFGAFSPETSLMLTLILYWLSFLMRPFGSMIFGTIGDLVGYRVALFSSMGFMALGTTMIGLIPSADSIGIFAPLLVIIARCLQGLSVSAEYTGGILVTTQLKENNNSSHPASKMASTTFIGLFIGVIVGIAALNPSLPTWSWRLCFILGGIIGIIALIIRYFLPQDPKYNQQQLRLSWKPLKTVWNNHKEPALIVMLIIGMGGLMSGYATVYINAYLVQYCHWTAREALMVVGVNVMVGAIAAWLGGGRVMRETLILYLIALPLLYSFICTIIHTKISFNNHLSVILSQAFASIFMGLFWGLGNQLIPTLFPEPIRYTGTATSEALGRAIIAGSTPFIMTRILALSPSQAWVVIYPILVSLICAWVLWKLKERLAKI